MHRIFIFLFVLVPFLLSSCGGGNSSDPLDQSLPDYETPLKPCSIKLGDDCIISFRTPMPHPQYQGTIVFADDMNGGNNLVYTSSSISYLVSITDRKQATINIPDLRPSGAAPISIKRSVRATLRFTSETGGEASWEIRHGSENPADQQTKSGAGTFTMSDL